MLKWGFIWLILHQVFGRQSRLLLTSDTSCMYDVALNLSGVFSEEEIILRKSYQDILHRLPSMQERQELYTALKSGEINEDILNNHLNTEKTFSLSSWAKNNDWKNYRPNSIYAWTIDLHPSPAACNFDIYRSIDVILHTEIDHHPFCEYYGVCSTDRLKIFGLGPFASGFSLDPNHLQLRKQFYEYYQNNTEFQRIDVIFCSHPAANCELFTSFQDKVLILFFTTRLEFGRNDMNIGWRRRTVSKWGANGEIENRQRDWISFIIDHFKPSRFSSIIKEEDSLTTSSESSPPKHHHNHHHQQQQQRLFLTANNMFDVKYVEYFTGITPIYIPSWCGDLDSSYNLQPNWVGCELAEEDPSIHPHEYPYPASKKDILFVPYKQRLWFNNGNLEALKEEFLHDFQLFTNSNNRSCQTTADPSSISFEISCPSSSSSDSSSTVQSSSIHYFIKHSALQFQNQQIQLYKQYPAMIFIPYQTSVMSFFEIYRQNIPIFAPSLSFLVQLDVKYHLVDGRVYGWPSRYNDLIAKVNRTILSKNIPNPNANYGDKDYEESANYWLQFSD
eukprot:gene16294-18465_t